MTSTEAVPPNVRTSISARWFLLTGKGKHYGTTTSEGMLFQFGTLLNLDIEGKSKKIKSTT